MLVRKFSLGLIKKVHLSKEGNKGAHCADYLGEGVPGKVPEFDKILVAEMEWIKRVTKHYSSLKENEENDEDKLRRASKKHCDAAEEQGTSRF